MPTLDEMLAAQAGSGSTSAPSAPMDALDSMLSKQAGSEQPASVSAGKVINSNLSSIPRQLGLTARYGLEGVANTLQMGTEPLRLAVTDPLMKLFGGKGDSKPLGEVATGAADWMGLPSPQTANERVIGDATRLVAGSGVMAGAARLAGGIPGAAGAIYSALAANPFQQLTAAAGAGLVGGASREAGGNGLVQVGASLLGGVAGGMAPVLAQGLSGIARRAVAPNLTPAQIDIQLSSAMGRAGTDYSQVPENVQRQLRSQLAGSLQAGKELDPEALRRMADFMTVGATPTRGMVSQNPVQITQEMNLAKMAANGSDGQLHGLPMMQNQNNATLIRNLNGLGADRGDSFAAGQRAIGAIGATDAAQGANVTGLYNTARAMPGGNTPLDRKAIVDNIYNSLAKENKMAFLPEGVSNMLNTISKGSINVNGQTHAVPFDANALDNLMTTIATAGRGNVDGNTKAALSIARKAIDGSAITPLNNRPPVIGNPLVTSADASAMRSADGESGAFMGAMNDARSAARSRFGWQESSRPVEAALGTGSPDDFVKKFVIGGTMADAQAVAKEAPSAGIKDAIMAHLKDKALGNSTDEMGKFSQSAFNKAVSQIGDQKLGLFFNAEEMGQLKALGRVASYMQVQPVGSAVNNSNSGALMLGKGMDLLNKTPVLGPMFGKPLENIRISIGQRQAQNAVPGLLESMQKTPYGPSLMLPGLAATGGLLSP